MKLYHLTFIVGLATMFADTLQAQDRPAYRIFTKDGRETDFGKVVNESRKVDVILFGELHDNSIVHWLELQVLKEVASNRDDVVIGMEMFEADDQVVLREYLEGTIEEKHLLSEAKIWDNYKNDYKPIVEFAKEKKIPVIATNVPRRYASLVFKKGMDALSGLSAESKNWIAPLPVEIDLTLPGYKEMLGMGSHGANINAENMARSQAIKDATMAHFILKNRKGIFIHYNGAFHSKNFDGIYWYLKKQAAQIRILTIHCVEQDNITTLEEGNKHSADFIIVTPRDMTKTY